VTPHSSEPTKLSLSARFLHSKVSRTVRLLLARPEKNQKSMREAKIKHLMLWAGANLNAQKLQYDELQPGSVEEQQFKRAKSMIGDLFEEYNPGAWHWSLVETINKLLLTGALCFIRPGLPAQSVAGLLMTFIMLQYYQKVLPFSLKPYRQIGYVMQLVLYLFFVTALLIETKIMVFASPLANDQFLAALCVILYVCVFAAPVYVTVQAVRAGLVEEEESDSESGSESGSDVGSESDLDEDDFKGHHKRMSGGGGGGHHAEKGHHEAEEGKHHAGGGKGGHHDDASGHYHDANDGHHKEEAHKESASPLDPPSAVGPHEPAEGHSTEVELAEVAAVSSGDEKPAEHALPEESAGGQMKRWSQLFSAAKPSE
jgi:hypothetical protein